MSRLKITNLWIWVILAFLILISAWTTLILVSIEHTPETIPLEHKKNPENARRSGDKLPSDGGY